MRGAAAPRRDALIDLSSFACHVPLICNHHKDYHNLRRRRRARDTNDVVFKIFKNSLKEQHEQAHRHLSYMPFTNVW